MRSRAMLNLVRPGEDVSRNSPDDEESITLVSDQALPQIFVLVVFMFSHSVSGQQTS